MIVLWPLAMCIEYWLLDIGHWPLSIGYDYWLPIFTLKNVATVITHFGYWPLSIAMLITHWLLVLVIDNYTRAIVGMVIINWLLPDCLWLCFKPIGYWPL